MSFFLLRRAAAALLVLTLALAGPSWAGGHGGGDAAGPAPLSFVVNLASDAGERYLKLDFVLETANPEAGKAVSTLLPRIQHRILLLLSEMKDSVLRTREGKLELAEAIQRVANKVIDETEKTGVTDVLYTNFLIQ